VRREFSAGGVLVRRLSGRWWFAAIRPAGRPESTWALPKGLVSPGDSPEATALREVAEETGLVGRADGKLGDVKYVYTASFEGGDGERVFKIVSFFLVRYAGGRLGVLPVEFRHEVAEAKWLPLDDAPRLLAYGGEKDMARKAIAFLEANEGV
jgi:8-oxo-dGTP pyrophosphatase MutT (NUDIX family)